MNEIHSQPIDGGVLTVYDNGDCSFLPGADAAIQATMYYPRGTGPYRYQVIASRAFDLVSGDSRGTLGRLSREDELGVPPSLRSSASRSRSDRRLLDERTRADEMRIRTLIQRGNQLGVTLGRLHARLGHLISTGTRGFTRHFTDSTSTPGLPRMVPTELQMAIDSGLVAEGANGALFVADRPRSLRTGIVQSLADALPGFFISYDLTFEQERDVITHEQLETAVMAVVDIATTLVEFGAPIIVRTLRQRLTTSHTAITSMRRGRMAGAAEEAVETAPVAAEREAISSSSDAPSLPAERPSPRSTDSAERGISPESRGTHSEEPGTATSRDAGDEGRAFEPHTGGEGTVSAPSSRLMRAIDSRLREVFGEDRLRDLLAGLSLFDEHLPRAIERVRSRFLSGARRAAAEVRLDEIKLRLTQIMDEYPMGDVLPDEARTEAITLLREGRRVARDRWNVVRERLWRELYNDPELQPLFETLRDDGLIRLPRGFPDSVRAPRAISTNRDYIIWNSARSGRSAQEIATEIGQSPEFVQRALARIRRSGTTPTRELSLALNLDHITPLQLNPFRFFDPNNLRMLNASFNDTWLRLYQIESSFPMTDDAFEAWIRAYDLR